LFTDDQADLTLRPAGQDGAPVRPAGAHPGDHLLETPVGALAEQARRPPLRLPVTTTTFPRSKRWVTERMARAGLQDRVEVLPGDHRRSARRGNDKLVSVERLRQVASATSPAFFRTCQRVCPGGRMASQAITIRSRYRHSAKTIGTWR
jgi:cyclopropane-fatty-acyl-phospholipid synthase